MGARGIHANEIVVAVKRDPAAGAADGVAIGRGNAPRDALFGNQGAPTAGNSAKITAILLLVRGLRVARGDILTHDLAVTAVNVNHGADAARLWGRGYLAHINCQAGILRPWITPPAIGRVLSQAGTKPVMLPTLPLPAGRCNIQPAPRMRPGAGQSSSWADGAITA